MTPDDVLAAIGGFICVAMVSAAMIATGLARAGRKRR